VSQQLEASALRFKIESAANTSALREASRILFDALVATGEHATAQAAAPHLAHISPIPRPHLAHASPMPR
jgi:hypothetical protein